MKQTVKYLSIAALVIVGAMSCNSLKEEIPGPDANDGTVTFTTTVGLDASTKALTSSGVKTFAAGDQIAVIYKNSSNQTVKAVSTALVAGDITNSGKNATFTVTLTNPKTSGSVRYIYPAAMAKSTIGTGDTINDAKTVNYDALATQNGTLTTLAANLDLAVFDGSLTAGAELPASATLTNQLAILALTLKNSGDSGITDNITGLIVSDGTNSYTISRSAAAGPIYVAIRPTSSANINVYAKSSSNYYTKTLTGKTYAAGNGYSITWRMSTYPTDVLSGKFTINAGGTQVQFAPGNLQATSFDNGTNWKWHFAVNQWDYVGNAVANTKINGNGTISSNGTVDLFGWVGASSSLSGNAQYGISDSNFGSTNNEALKTDWGNAIGSGWRTLNKEEWDYLLNTRSSGSTVNGTSNARYAYATINTDGTSVYGVILFPDGKNVYNSEATSWGNINSNSGGSTQCTSSQWSSLASNGCVFLPAAGFRDGSTFSYVGTDGYYWTSSSYSSSSSVYYLHVYGGNALAPNTLGGRSRGHSVRLVK